MQTDQPQRTGTAAVSLCWWAFLIIPLFLFIPCMFLAYFGAFLFDAPNTPKLLMFFGYLYFGSMSLLPPVWFVCVFLHTYVHMFVQAGKNIFCWIFLGCIAVHLISWPLMVVSAFVGGHIESSAPAKNNAPVKDSAQPPAPSEPPLIISDKPFGES